MNSSFLMIEPQGKVDPALIFILKEKANVSGLKPMIDTLFLFQNEINDHRINIHFLLPLSPVIFGPINIKKNRRWGSKEEKEDLKMNSCPQSTKERKIIIVRPIVSLEWPVEQLIFVFFLLADNSFLFDHLKENEKERFDGDRQIGHEWPIEPLFLF